MRGSGDDFHDDTLRSIDGMQVLFDLPVDLSPVTLRPVAVDEDPVGRRAPRPELQARAFTNENISSAVFLETFKDFSKVHAGEVDEKLEAAKVTIFKAIKEGRQHKLDENYESYYVQTDAAGKRWTLVLGWDASIVVKKTQAGYEPVALYQPSNSHKLVWGKLPQTKPVPTLPTKEKLKLSVGGDDTWDVYPVPGVVLERVVTYGISSCAFTVLTTKNLEYTVISHMNNSRKVPNAAILEHQEITSESYKLFGSFFDDDEEDVLRVTDDPTFASPKISGKIGLRHTRLAHNEAAVEFPKAEVPKIVGLYGLSRNAEYYNLFDTVHDRTKQRLSRLWKKHDNGYFHLFDLVDPTGGPETTLRRGLYANGFLAPKSTSKKKVSEGTWDVTVTHTGGEKRTYRVTSRSEQVEVLTNKYQFTPVSDTSETMMLTRSGPTLSRMLEFSAKEGGRRGDIDSAIEELGLAEAPYEYEVVQGKQYHWTLKIEDGESYEIVSLDPDSRMDTHTFHSVWSKDEPYHFILDVMAPLLKDDDLGAVHRSVLEEFKARLEDKGSKKVLVSKFRKVHKNLQRELYKEIDGNTSVKDPWAAGKIWQYRVIRLVGQLLDHLNTAHLYHEALGKAIGAHRYRFEVPMNEL